MGSGVCGRCCCPRRQTGNQPSLAQKRGQRDQQLYYLKPVLSGMEVLKLYNRIFSFPLIFPFPFQVYRPVTRALVMPSSFAGLSWSWLDLVVWANDQEFWTWQNLGRNPASIRILNMAEFGEKSSQYKKPIHCMSNLLNLCVGTKYHES